ncbi:MAG: L-histidine N(alpha)-methyltransferase [Phycisphaerae bacterium]
MKTMQQQVQVVVQDLAPDRETFLRDVLAGLGQPRKRLSSKYLYDQRGSQLFERICELDEYYLTRTELAIMEQHLDEMTACLGAGCLLIEFGSGSSTKTRMLLDHLEDPAGYVPMDISGDHLAETAAELVDQYPDVEILPVCADFTQPFVVPAPRLRVRRKAVYFPGSTIGNLDPHRAKALLDNIVDLTGRGGALLIGVDLKKDTAILEPAYNDAEGVTAEFNLNLLERINGELGADFDVEAFDHHAFYNEYTGAVESHLVSQVNQTVHINGTAFAFKRNESIHTENSFKFSLDQFAAIAEQVGLSVRKVWTDDDDLFSVQYLIVD